MQQEIINKYTPDIIGLQEAGRGNSNPTLFPALTDTFLADYTKILSDQASNRNGLASKIQISDYECVKYTNNDSENWDYQKCYITVANKRIAWFNTHLTWEHTAAAKARKRQQATEFFNAVEQEEYAIVTGDFNMYDAAFDGYDYISIGKPFADAGYRLANWNDKVGFVKTYTGATSASSLSEFTLSCDNIIVTPNIQIISVTFDTTKLDWLDGNKIDHIPVIAELKIR
jgi:endonuclease/exonuclease/phosphatase family metal-dependent hydrolase